MDWVHCNNCFLLPDRDKCFYLTSCGHIFCRDCEGNCARNTCKLCGNQCTSIPLSSSMKSDVQMYFTDPDQLLKSKLKEVQKIALFQRNHRARLMTFYRKELNKYKQMKDGFKKILQNLKDLESERKTLSKENAAFKKIFEMSGLSRSLGGTPASAVMSSGGHKIGSMFPPGSAPPSAHMNPRFTQFFNKLDKSGASTSSAGRVSLLTPPVNGKIGGIAGSPSPSSAFRNLKLSTSFSLSNQKENINETIVTPSCSQMSSEYDLLTQSAPSTQTQTWPPDNNSNNVTNQSKKDPRRVIVHPYSPDD